MNFRVCAFALALYWPASVLAQTTQGATAADAQPTTADNPTTPSIAVPNAAGRNTTEPPAAGSNASGPSAAMQNAAVPRIARQDGAPAPVAPSPEALAIARTLVTKSGGGGLMTMSGLSLPLTTVIKQLHLRPDQGRQALTTVLMPVLLNHTDELSDVQARSYASVLSVDSMKAAIAFYDTPAGRALVAAHGRITQMNMQALQALFTNLMPEFQAKAAVVFKADTAPKN